MFDNFDREIVSVSDSISKTVCGTRSLEFFVECGSVCACMVSRPAKLCAHTLKASLPCSPRPLHRLFFSYSNTSDLHYPSPSTSPLSPLEKGEMSRRTQVKNLKCLFQFMYFNIPSTFPCRDRGDCICLAVFCDSSSGSTGGVSRRHYNVKFLQL